MFEVVDNENSLVDCLAYVENIELYNEGNVRDLDGKEYEIVLIKLKDIFARGRLMPAFGVSLHDETVKAMRGGEWLKINFNHELTKNGLPFTALVIELNTVYGTNLIREYNGSYFGRCLYLDFDAEVDLTQLSI